jgi:hypothetical protein
VIVNVNSSAYITDKTAILVVSGDSNVSNPAIFAIMPAQSAFFPERSSLIEGIFVNVMAVAVILGVYDLGEIVQEVGFGSPVKSDQH